MKQLSGLDAAFLNLEMPHTPMHIGGVYIFSGQAGERPFDFEHFRQHIVSRLPVSPIFRRRLLAVPLHLEHPYWVDDPEFDVNLHLLHVALPQPAGMRELMELAASIFARPLDRSRPLWEATFVEGLDRVEGVPPGSVAMIAKVHHAAVDGISGEEVLAALLDPTPVPRAVPAGEWQPAPLPSTARVLLQSLGSALRSPAKSWQLARRIADSYGRSLRERLLNTGTLPPALFSAPPIATNGPVTTRRVFGGAQLSQTRIRRIKNAVPGVTLNDVALTVCAGALREYLRRQGALPDEPLVAMTPISLRSPSQYGSGGNLVSALLVSLATTEADPLRRIECIHQSVRGAMEFSKIVRVAELAETLPSLLVAPVTSWYLRNRLSQRHRPFFNLVTTNVPGPRRPLYFNGARLLLQLGAGPIMDGIGLIIVITSYADTVGIGMTSCREVIPDIHELSALLPAALDELEEAACERDSSMGLRPVPAASVTVTSSLSGVG